MTIKELKQYIYDNELTCVYYRVDIGVFVDFVRMSTIYFYKTLLDWPENSMVIVNIDDDGDVILG